MSHEPSPSRPASPLAGFSDLARWTGERKLAELALNGVQALDANQPLPKDNPLTGSCPRMMLTLLSYCYSRGWYGTGQIEQAMAKDPMVRYLCARHYPDGNAIRRFRRENRPWLLACLTHILMQAWALKLDNAEVDFLGYNWFETEFTREINREVQLRIDLASYIDMMELQD